MERESSLPFQNTWISTKIFLTLGIDQQERQKEINNEVNRLIKENSIALLGKLSQLIVHNSNKALSDPILFNTSIDNLEIKFDVSNLDETQLALVQGMGIPNKICKDENTNEIIYSSIDLVKHSWLMLDLLSKLIVSPPNKKKVEKGSSLINHIFNHQECFYLGPILPNLNDFLNKIVLEIGKELKLNEEIKTESDVNPGCFGFFSAKKVVNEKTPLLSEASKPPVVTMRGDESQKEQDSSEEEVKKEERCWEYI